MNVGDHVLVACIMVEGNGVVHRQTHDPPKNQVRANLCLNVSFQQKHEKKCAGKILLFSGGFCSAVYRI